MAVTSLSSEPAGQGLRAISSSTASLQDEPSIAARILIKPSSTSVLAVIEARTMPSRARFPNRGRWAYSLPVT
jgi:hypothetical protein